MTPTFELPHYVLQNTTKMDLNLLTACEALVSNVVEKTDISDEGIQRWQSLFGLTSAESRAALEDWRSDFGRTTIRMDTWDAIKHAWPDFDKEAYEYALAVGKLMTNQSKPSGVVNDGAKYILCLEAGVPDLDEIQAIGNLSYQPTLYHGMNDDGEATEFCIIDWHTKASILKWLSIQKSLFRPKFIRHSEAQKSLDVSSRYPTLGIDTTLPQFRLNNDPIHPGPSQDEYPVWYFFYGTLAEPEVLSQVLHLTPSNPPELHVAQIRGGCLTMWGGKYKALVHSPDGKDGPPVQGWAFLVKSQEEEDALRHYETERYTVTRCEIEFLNSSKLAWSRLGLTFMFNTESLGRSR